MGKKVSFKKAKGFTNTACPKGWYPALFEKIEVGTSKKGNLQFAIVLSVTEGDFTNRKFFDYLPANPDTPGAIRTKNMLMAFNFDADGGVELEEVANDLIERACFVKVSVRKEKDLDGNMIDRNRVQQYSSDDPGEETPTKADLPEEQRQEFEREAASSKDDEEVEEEETDETDDEAVEEDAEETEEVEASEDAEETEEIEEERPRRGRPPKPRGSLQRSAVRPGGRPAQTSKQAPVVAASRTKTNGVRPRR